MLKIIRATLRFRIAIVGAAVSGDEFCSGTLLSPRCPDGRAPHALTRCGRFLRIGSDGR